MNVWTEARAGLHAGIHAAAPTLTHGMIAFAALGAAGVAFGMAATALLTAGLLAAMRSAGLGEAILLAMLLAGLAGLLMLVLSAIGLARLAGLVPTPVTQGLGNAIALLVVLGQVPLLLGGAPGAAAPWHAPLPAPGCGGGRAPSRRGAGRCLASHGHGGAAVRGAGPRGERDD